MTKALDAAVRAAQEQYDDHGADDDIAIAAALRAALPAEQPATSDGRASSHDASNGVGRCFICGEPIDTTWAPSAPRSLPSFLYA